MRVSFLATADKSTFPRPSGSEFEEVPMNALGRLALVVTAAAVVAGPAVPATAAAPAESFETGFGSWQPDTDGLAPAWSVTRSTEQARHGVYSLRVYMDGRQDDGTTWVERRFKVAPNTTVRVTVAFHLWSSRQSDVGTWFVVAAAGTRDPETERDFTRLGSTEQAAGWKQYSALWTVTADAAGAVWVAFGTSVAWETERHHYLDYVSVTIQPAIGPALPVARP